MGSLVAKENVEGLDILPLFESAGSNSESSIFDSDTEAFPAFLPNDASAAPTKSEPEVEQAPIDPETREADPVFQILKKVFANRYIDSSDAYKDYYRLINDQYQSRLSEAFDQGMDMAKREVDHTISSNHQQTELLLKKHHAEADKLQGRLTQSISQIEELNKTFKHQIQVEALELAMQMATCIIQKQLSLSPEWAIDMAKEHVKALAGSGSITISVNDGQVHEFRSHRAELLESVDGIREIVFKSDPELELGDLIIEHKNGRIDACLHTQVLRLKDQINPGPDPLPSSEEINHEELSEEMSQEENIPEGNPEDQGK